ncbi:MAG TPA: hypothetical protein VFC46_17445 [Humisphaera sp.]|nr:hypothetical protein [Humisphaera sp.]
MPDNRKYFFVKHGLDSFQVMPNFIWRTEEKDEPRIFKRVKKGDRWIGFAFTTSDSRERTLSQITGFYECTRESRFGELPQKARQVSGCKNAWMIEGKRWGKQPRQPVGVPPIDELLKMKTFKGQTLVPIIKGEKEFERVREYTLDHELDPGDIPFLGREPRTEQEVLAVVLCCHQKLGIEKILRIRTAFPDLLVKLKGRTEPVHLELETYSKSFLVHGHAAQVCNRQFKTDENAERKPVGILCWVDNAKASEELKNCVHKVYELQSLIRNREKIRW